MCKKVNYSNETIKTKLRFVSKFKDNKIVWVSCNQTKKLNSNHAYKKSEIHLCLATIVVKQNNNEIGKSM